jgi:hypothetical protein
VRRQVIGSAFNTAEEAAHAAAAHRLNVMPFTVEKGGMGGKSSTPFRFLTVPDLRSRARELPQWGSKR